MKICEIRVVFLYFLFQNGLNATKYCEENTEYPIFTSSELLSLTHGDNNYSALIRRT